MKKTESEGAIAIALLFWSFILIMSAIFPPLLFITVPAFLSVIGKEKPKKIIIPKKGMVTKAVKPGQIKK